MRALDFSLSLVMLVLASPVFSCLILAGSIKFGSPFFLQRRVGKNNVSFIIYKFRSLPLSTPDVPTHELNLPNISAYGKWLRKSKLDELPQLLNVINGQMSLVGPRPCLPSQAEIIRLRKISGVLAMRPGITGLAQLQNYHMEYPERVVELDREMQLNLSVVLYCKILFATVFQITGLKGVI